MNTPLPTVARCRRCGAPIAFRETANGRLQPVDPDTGAVHFATCSARPPAKTAHLRDDACLRCGSLNTERRPGTALHFAGLKCSDCGAFRWLPKPRPASEVA